MKRSRQALLTSIALLGLAVLAVYAMDRVETSAQAEQRYDVPQTGDVQQVLRQMRRLEIQLAEVEARVEDLESGPEELDVDVSDQGQTPENPWEDWGTRSVQP